MKRQGGNDELSRIFGKLVGGIVLGLAFRGVGTGLHTLFPKPVPKPEALEHQWNEGQKEDDTGKKHEHTVVGKAQHSQAAQQQKAAG